MRGREEAGGVEGVGGGVDGWVVHYAPEWEGDVVSEEMKRGWRFVPEVTDDGRSCSMQCELSEGGPSDVKSPFGI